MFNNHFVDNLANIILSTFLDSLQLSLMLKMFFSEYVNMYSAFSSRRDIPVRAYSGNGIGDGTALVVVLFHSLSGPVKLKSTITVLFEC